MGSHSPSHPDSNAERAVEAERVGRLPGERVVRLDLSTRNRPDLGDELREEHIHREVAEQGRARHVLSHRERERRRRTARLVDRRREVKKMLKRENQELKDSNLQ